MARACCGVTRAGRPCSLTSESILVDDKGRSVAAPLRDLSGNLVILMLDLETTGVDATQDRIVELSAVQALPKSPGACFSTVVQVDADISSAPGARKAAEVSTKRMCSSQKM